MARRTQTAPLACCVVLLCFAGVHAEYKHKMYGSRRRQPRGYEGWRKGPDPFFAHGHDNETVARIGRRLADDDPPDFYLALDLSGLTCANPAACILNEVLAEQGLPCEPFREQQIAIDFPRSTVSHNNLGGTGCTQNVNCETKESNVCPSDGSGLTPLGPTHWYHRNAHADVPGFDAWIASQGGTCDLQKCENEGPWDEALYGMLPCGGGCHDYYWGSSNKHLWISKSDGQPGPKTAASFSDNANGIGASAYEMKYFGSSGEPKHFKHYVGDASDRANTSWIPGYDPVAESWINPSAA